MKYALILFLTTLSLLSACSGKNTPEQQALIVNTDSTDTAYSVLYAKGFTVKQYSDYKEVTVRNPWDTTKVLQQYFLVDKSKQVPPNLPKGILIRTPLNNVVAYSTIHCSTLNELNLLNTIKGVCEPEYISIPYIGDRIKKGSIINLGQASNPMVEKVIELDPEAIFATPIEGQTYGNVIKTGIPIIETPDYMEATPLGRAEWIRFYSLFFNNELYADSLFNNTVANYNAIKEKATAADIRPDVFIDLMYRGIWHISGGESFISKMLQDAGATYVWQNDERTTAKPFAFEQVLNDAGNAHFWLIKYNQATDLTYSGLKKEYQPYSYFSAFKNRNIYECNTKTKNYYEDLPIHPDYILQDFAYLFHPDLFPDYTPKYYSKMKE